MSKEKKKVTVNQKETIKKKDWDSFVGYRVLARLKNGECFIGLRQLLGQDDEFALVEMADYKEEEKYKVIKEFQVESVAEAIAYFRGFTEALNAEVLVALNQFRTMVASIK